MKTQTEAQRLAQEFADAYKASTPGTWKKGRTSHHTVTDNNYGIGEFHHAADAQFCDTAHKLAVPIVSELRRLAAANAELEQMNTQLREQNDAIDVACAKLEAANAKLESAPFAPQPAQREWVWLSDDEIHDLQIENIDNPWANFKAIEAKVKEKNT
jgi:hypothetical protein